MTLGQWQERLEKRFESLARSREGSGFPIFALEHGLNDKEIEEISSLLRSHLRFHLSLDPYWLLWAIYAAERGYTYDGDEYWRSFEEQTPEWIREYRDKLVPCFKKFQKAYEGFVPSGRWAKHFSIIAWPITHAILPRYLQRQFAEILYNLRFRLVRLAEPSPVEIGRLLAVNALHTSSRFQQFLQQEELTGRIVLGLLGTTPAKGKEPIYPLTLQRILSDLEQVQRSRERLKETRRVVTNFKGIGHSTGSSGPYRYQPRTPHGGDTAPDIGQLGIQPRLLLGHRGGDTWSVRLEIPSFRSVASLNAEVHSFLKRARCRINGTPGIKGRGWLLSGNRTSPLKSWPDPDTPLIQLSPSHDTIDHLLESECRLSPGPIWLFKVAQDGNAHEIIGRIVRPGSSYLVVTTDTLPEPHGFIRPCPVELECDGVKAIRFSIPPRVSADDIGWLRRLDLKVARTVRVWPAGLSGRGWDGEGRSEWLTTETPCLGIRHDYLVDAYVLRLKNDAETVIAETVIRTSGGERPLFVQIEPLPAGIYTLTVQPKTSLASIAGPDATGFIQLRVREPEPWIPDIVSHPCLITTLDPPDANLDLFWQNEVNVSVRGPEGRTVSCTVSLTGWDGKEILLEQIGGPMELPVKPEVWRNEFGQFLKNKQHAWSYLEATSGFLTIAGEELGRSVFRFEHDVIPLRWVLRRDRSKIALRLIDETGEEEEPLNILFFSMEYPLQEEHRAPDEALKDSIAPEPGGLFLAQHGEHCARVIVSTPRTTKNLQDLNIKPAFSGSTDLLHCLQLLGSWGNALLYGPLARVRQETVTTGLLAEIYGRLCGPNWTRRETAFRENPASPSVVDALYKAVDQSPDFASALRQGSAKIGDDMAATSQWYAGAAERYKVSRKPELCDFALRLASQPHRLSETFNADEMRNLLNQVKNRPALVRGARLLALLSANRDRIPPTRMLPRWRS